MIYSNIQGEAKLVTLEGDRLTLESILSENDYNRLLSGSDFDEDEVEYYADAYPELMGVAGTVIAKVGGGIARIVRRIAKRIRARRARRAGVMTTPPQQPQPGPQYGPQPSRGPGLVYNRQSGYQGQYPVMQQPTAKSNNNQLIMLSAFVGLGIYMVMSKPKSRGKK